jgi:hypothetical protein
VDAQTPSLARPANCKKEAIMPPRLITLGIVLFWLGMTSWLVVREVVPMVVADDIPSVQVDFTDTLGAGALVGWVVMKDNKRIGSGTSRILVDEAQEWYEFRSQFHYDQFTIGPAQIQHLESMYRVTKEGQLKSLSAKASIKSAGLHFDVGVDGVVEDGFLEPRVFGLLEQKLDKIPINQQGNVLNPMHLVNKLRGLREGKIWKIPLLDPLASLKEKFIAKGAGEMPMLIAEVKVDTLTWNRRPVACYKIEYYEPGKEPIARTWARKSDGLVLQQEASHLGYDMVLIRVPQ